MLGMMQADAHSDYLFLNLNFINSFLVVAVRVTCDMYLKQFTITEVFIFPCLLRLCFNFHNKK